ncbi:nucleotidyl transferase AbiEii/AbiGii toxin family protein [Plantactinospora sp. B6F1]|uniref:nucleotidyl transferase AbiEii/AbiGii toxin family protein n=1 Tax=Plantactinospora sp. B6F1 TaxID=3158971 RepID=UPI0032D9642E
MSEVSGDFEIHVTVHAEQAGKLAAFAAQHGVKYLHIVLDRGAYASQPMLTLTGRGSLAEQHATVRRWQDELRAAGVHPCRAKIEAAPWCVGVPRSDREAAGEPAGRYFEHDVKLLLPGTTVAELLAVTDVVTPHGARLSRNARRERADGAQERFVTQRCHGVGLDTAGQRLDALVEALRSAGHEIVAVEQEYVVFDDQLSHDQGWLTDVHDRHTSDQAKRHEDRMRIAPAGSPNYPPTYRPLPAEPAVRQRAAFDPALKQYRHAYRAGEPTFLVAATGERWCGARHAAMNRILTAIAGTRWGAEHLVLRGSVTMAAWVGDAAREPGDLDFVVTPHTVTSDSADAGALLDDLKAAVRRIPEDDAGLRADQITETAIWTYERADGRRLAIPFHPPEAPEGHVQLDIVFGERLPLAPEALMLPGVDEPVRAASAELSLAWKLLWLATDMYPQGKDLYDAVLLAEHTTVDPALVRTLMRPELGAEADTFTAETVLGWKVDWTNFVDEYPGVGGTAQQWVNRLASALDRAWA